MESSTRLKYSEGIDRISALPEALQSTILSLLPTKDAVATSILSKRWKFVWTSITNLSFDFDLGFYYKSSGEVCITRMQEFTQFVNSVLVLLNPPFIQNFYLNCLRECCDPFYLQLWICAAIRRTIQKLELQLMLVKPMELPLSQFNCKTLTVLRMFSYDMHFNVVASASLCFPNLLTLDLQCVTFTIANNCSLNLPSLKNLFLDYVNYANEESVQKLFASCPVLESLQLGRYYCDSASDNIRCFIISIPSLRRLATYSSCDEEHRTCREYKLQIITPALQYLELNDDSLCEYSTFENLSCLIKATVTFDFNQSSCRRLSHVKKKQENIFKFVGGLVNVRSLSLSGRILKAIGSISESIAPVFSNLTRLEIERHSCRDWSFVITNLLERMDNLDSLTLSSGGYCRGSHESWWMEPLSVPMCLLRRVTEIDITTRGDCNSELELVRYFLKNAEVLQLMRIHSSCGPKAKFKLTQKISMIPRGSRACQVEFI